MSSTRQNLLFVTILGFSATLFAQGHGVSSYPLDIQQKYVSIEWTGIVSHGRGSGLQARYMQRVRPQWTVSGGFGFSNGERANRIFVNADYELYPDYQKQPRVSLRGILERSRDFGSTHTKVGVAPVVSKGLSFWGQEGFPFISVPVALDLDSGRNRYEVISQLALGAAVPIRTRTSQKIVANIEVNMNISGSYSGIFFGLSHPL